MYKRIKISSFLLALAPCLSMYLLLPGTNLGLFVYLCAIILSINLIRVKYNLERIWFYQILLMSLFGYVMNYSTPWFSVPGFINNLWPITICFATLIVVVPHVDPKIFKKSFLFISIFAAIIVIGQRLSIILTGAYYSNFYLPLFELSDDIAYSLNRPSAFFKEPAHIAIYLLPAYYLSLLDKKYIYVVLFAFGILASSSSTGFILVGLSTIIWLLFDTRGVKNRIAAILLLGIGVAFVIKYQSVIIVDDHIEKLTNTESSSSIRLLGGLTYFKSFTILEKIFGIGFNQLSNYFGINREIANYSNAVLFMLISYGYLGLLSLGFYLFKLFRLYKPQLGFYVILLGVMLSSQLLFHDFLIHLLTFCMIGNKLLDKNLNPQRSFL